MSKNQMEIMSEVFNVSAAEVHAMAELTQAAEKDTIDKAMMASLKMGIVVYAVANNLTQSEIEKLNDFVQFLDVLDEDSVVRLTEEIVIKHYS
jgi:hypothetical protein